MASVRQWWGDVAEDVPERTIIDVQPRGGGDWRVTFRNVVGLVAVPGLQIEVEPKIPRAHFLHLLSRAHSLPRLDEQLTAATEDSSLWELLVTWFLVQTELVLRRDLMRDYQQIKADLRIVRGRVGVLETARRINSGRLEIACEFEEFSSDMPLNRILKAAAAAAGASPLLEWATRRRALRILARMEDVGSLRPGDLRHVPSRTTAHYTYAVALARHVLQGRGRAPRHGESAAWTFLIRTPEVAEQGIRAILRAGLHPIGVEAGRWTAMPSKVSFNPDLVFAGTNAVGDVKYKFSGADWSRSDLYQAISFGTAFKSTRALVIGFTEPGTGGPPDVHVGGIHVRHVGWDADPYQLPERAAEDVVARVRTFLASSNHGSPGHPATGHRAAALRN